MTYESEILAFEPSGLQVPFPPPPGGYGQPTGVAVDSSGNVWVSNYSGHSIEEFTSADVPTGVAVNTRFQDGSLHFDGPGTIAVDSLGNLYVLHHDPVVVDKYNAAGEFQYVVDPETVEHAYDIEPAIDPSTNDVYIARQGEIVEYIQQGS